MKSHDDCSDPMIISVGHKITLKTALKLVISTCKFRVPEPVNKYIYLLD